MVGFRDRVAQVLIKTMCPVAEDVRAQTDLPVAALAGPGFRLAHQRATDPLAARFRRDHQAPDLGGAVGLQMITAGDMNPALDPARPRPPPRGAGPGGFRPGSPAP